MLCRKMDSTLKVVRVKLDGGDRVVGIKYPEILIPLVEQSLHEQKAMEHMVQQQIQMVSTDRTSNLNILIIAYLLTEKIGNSRFFICKITC